MAPKKLTEADKKAILGLYRQPEETTSTLAERYGVSNSTISRLLKATLPEAEYSALIQQKRSSGDKAQPLGLLNQPIASPEPTPAFSREPTPKAPILKKREMVAEETVVPGFESKAAADGGLPAAPEIKSTPGRRVRSRTQPQASEGDATQLSLTADLDEESLSTLPSTDFGSEEMEADLTASWDDESPLGDDYDDEDDEDDEEDEAWDGEGPALAPQLKALEISPLTAEDLPSLCYLVVERASSELVALPLRTFASLGQIPEEEGESRTLPVFDNHRIARRFSRRNQRVIKVPDGALLQTTSSYLQAKGITRLLIDGQVFALEEREDRVEATP